MRITPTSKVLLLLGPSVAALALYGLGFRQDGVSSAPAEERVPRATLMRHLIPGTDELQLIVELEEPGVIAAAAGAEAGGAPPGARLASDGTRVSLGSPEARAAAAKVAAAQARLADRLAAVDGAQLQAAVDLVLNALVVRVPANQYETIRSLPGVRRVHFSRERRLALDAAAILHNSPVLWDRVGGPENAGKGVKIGIIDTGIDIDNPMFIDPSLTPPSGYPKGEAAFTNSKVIAARQYLNLLRPQTVRTAIDEVGHGTFVAGCAAGKRVSAPLATISGTAPAAFLGSYKIFGTPGINDTTNNAAVIAAINGAVGDGMDVLNLSFGALDYVPAEDDPEIDAVNAAVAAGVVVVISAGNEGPGTHTVGNPGTADRAITVGAVTNSRVFANQLRPTAPQPVPDNLTSIPYTNGTGPQIPTRLAARKIVDVATLDSDGLGCSSLPGGSLTGSIAFILRGTCTFAAKVSNAAGAGATAVVVYNNVPGGGKILMGGLEGTSTPSVMISNADGLALKEFIAAHPAEVMVEIDDSGTPQPKPETPRVVTDFSSRGPGSNYNLKPDLVAVGEAVYSAAQNNDTNGDLYSSSQFTSAQGTSFSSPMVAGAAAALTGLYPSLSPDGIKSLMVNTAVRTVKSEGGATADLLQGGAGMLDLASASEAVAVLSPATLSFGIHAYPEASLLRKTLTITNVSTAPDQYLILVEPLVSGPSVQLSRSSTPSVSPGGSITVDVTISAESPVTGGFQGFVVLQSVRTSRWYRVPYWAGLYREDRSRVLRVAQDAGIAGAYRSLGEALDAAQPGNVVEIADDAVYSGSLVIATNAEGLPLHGLTLRAAAGKSPTLTTLSTTDPVILVVGARDVLLQGLTIRGSFSAVLLDQPAARYPTSATIDRCSVLNSGGSSSSDGVLMYGAGSVFVTNTTISDFDDAGVWALGGGNVTVTRSTIQRSGAVGIVLSGGNLQVLSSTITANQGPGVLCLGCQGTVDGSTVSRNLGSFGDGLEIVDGYLTVTDTLFEGNERAAVGIFADTGFAGGRGLISGNRFRANRYGALLNPGVSVVLERNTFQGNARGLRFAGSTTATVTNNIIDGSTDASVGDGVQVAGTANVRLLNNTIIRNRRSGIAFSTGATVSVENCIVAGNSNGDLDGVDGASVRYSLIGSALPAGGSNNVTGDPKLAGPDDGNFEPGAGSVAIDAGTNSASALPFVDFTGRLRVASLGAATGEGRVDIGAVEAGSSYPLVFPLIANGPQPLPGGNFTTGVAVFNPAPETVQGLFNAYGPGGGLLAGLKNPSPQTIEGLSQVPVLGFQLFGYDAASSQLGSVLASSTRRLLGFFLVFDSEFRNFADGVDVSAATATDLLMLRHLNDSTGRTAYSVTNPGTEPANIAATLYTTGGTAVGAPRTAAIAPKGSVALSFESTTLSSGYVRVRSDRPVTALELYGTSTEVAALRAASAGSDGQLYFPHYAVNGGYSTVIGILNSASSATNLVLTAYSGEGMPLGNPVQRTLIAGAMLFEPVADLFSIPAGPLSTGYIVARGTRPGLTGFTSFRYEGGVVRSSAAVPAASVPRARLVFSHIAHQVAAGSGGTYQTGIALLNPYGVAVPYTIRVFAGNGNLVAENSDVLLARAKVARILSHPVPGVGFFTEPLPLGSGHIEVLCDYGLLGFELFFTEDLSQLASVPAQIP